MAGAELMGGHPKSCEPAAGEVVLTRTEQAFLSLVLLADGTDPDFQPTEAELETSGRSASLTLKQSRFIQDWVKHKGDLFDLFDEELYAPSRVTRFLSSPSVLRILSEASRLRPDLPPPIPTKEELAVTWGMVSRDSAMPLGHQKEARTELAKLMGYYPNGADGVNVGVQVVLKGDLTLD